MALQGIDLQRLGEPVVNIDVAGVVSQFLSELSSFDLVVELVQNDLDASATRTEIAFGSDRLVCTGNGKAIDAAGWQRLAYVLGAGNEVDAKPDGIGSKNHGLRSAFLLGDQVVVQSGGQRIDLTVRGNQARKDLFFPAVWPRVADPSAPRSGTRVTVPYRSEPLKVPERNPLEPLSDASLAHLFEDAVKRAADRFIRASSPGRTWRYTLALSHGRQHFTFTFQCARVPGQAGVFLRTCRQTSDRRRRGRIVARRLCTAFEVDLDKGDRAKVPRLFRRGKKILGEISWAVDVRMRPLPGCGALRYPIAYPIEHISNGWGFDISGPFISGRARHSISDDARNGHIIRAGRDAFATLMASRLVPRYGPEALVLATSAQGGNHAAEEELAYELAHAGALPLATPDNSKPRRSTRYLCADPDEPVLLPAPSHAPRTVCKHLARLAASYGQALHPASPQPLVDALMRLADEGSPVLTPFSERDAARLVLVDQALSDSSNFDAWLRQCSLVMRTLAIARAQDSLKADFLRSLREEGFLPTTERRAAQWSQVRRSTKPIPAVPGVVSPYLLHDSLAKSPILKEGAGKVLPFKLDEHVSNLDFSDVNATGRMKFFRWLRKGHRDLAPKTLAQIARYPIWPAVDGSFQTLDYFCYPNATYLRAALAEVRIPPSDSVIRFPGLRGAPNASLRLRRTPFEDELSDWHAARMTHAEDAYAEGRTDDLRTIVESTESTLTRLRKDRFPVDDIAGSHRSLSCSGALIPVDDLHVPTPEVRGCALLPEDVAAIDHYSSLYRSLGAQLRPSPAAILRAFRAAPDSSALFSRLRAYRHSGSDLSELADEIIIPVGGRLLAPGTLCFPSKTNWWGDWKISLDWTPDTPEQTALLEGAGVVRAALREELSRAFFDWVASQPETVQRNHLQQIVRHWNDRRSGPSKWIASDARLPCVPVHDKRGKFELLSLTRARRKTVFLPDFESLQRDVLQSDARIHLAIVEAQGVDGSILEILKSVGVPSLRARAGRPVRLMAGTETSDDPDLDAELTLVKSRPVVNSLPQRLPKHDVPNDALRYGWRRLVSELEAVRTARSLTAVYEIGHRTYEVAVQSGVDQPTRQVCVTGHADRILAFYEAVAGYLFEIGSSRLYAYGLMSAVRSGANRQLFDELDGVWREDVSAEDEGDNATGTWAEDEAPREGHGIPDAEAKPVAPEPSRLKPITRPTYRNSAKKQPKRRAPSRTDTKRHSIEEDQHIFELKSKHYVWHCQACLGERDVLKLTPPHSYVYLPRHRKGLIEAHHVQHLQNEGTIGASNLLILCRYHHETLGDSLAREGVLNALHSAIPAKRHFPIDEDGTTQKTEGLLATLGLQTRPLEVRLFFTSAHADAWWTAEDRGYDKPRRFESDLSS